ncbi:succinate--CoA ligase [GDP-forming] subunit beta, mitochondrial [Culicoides brevitarsis]|uniref:succinate--CoA ligase [GDP-forming] subunit beta, mitochondrial n=1 Tax=Culicoides brevitarsis TaxID=469753 RepID=UPI00307BD27B
MSRLILGSVVKKAIFQKSLNQVQKTSSRNLNLLEFQSKKLLDDAGVQIQAFRVVQDKQKLDPLNDFNVKEYVVKAQILAGGRGKGVFDSGLKGGVQITTDRTKMMDLVKQMIGHKLITKQTPKDGLMVKSVMVADSINILRETYLCILMDRENNGPVLIASPAGGVDIEAVAEKTPELIKTVPINVERGLDDKTCTDIAEFLEFKGPLVTQAAKEIKKLYELFNKVDAVQIEINPLAETDDGRVISVDAKLNFDDNAKFRQKEIFNMEVVDELDPKEVEAVKYNLNYISMDGNIGCMVNGAGLAMATCDIIKLNGGNPANFLDVGGSVKEDQVEKAFQILTSDPKVKVLFVNIFGGIVNCATIANGIVGAAKNLGLNLPLVVRLQGNNVTQAVKILKESGLPIHSVSNLDEAAKKAVDALKECK